MLILNLFINVDGCPQPNEHLRDVHVGLRPPYWLGTANATASSDKNSLASYIATKCNNRVKNKWQ